MHLLPILHEYVLSSAPSATRMRILVLCQDTLDEQRDGLATEEP
jgi:hypothetical protein